MINNLKELNDKVNAFVNYVVKTACEHTTSGQYYVSVVEACKAAGMSYEDFSQYKDFVFEELSTREELLDFDFNEKDFEFDVNCGLNYCPGYQWCDGDEDIFECSYEEWLESPIKPVAQPLSMSQMAEIGAGAISFLAHNEARSLEDVVKNLLCFDDDMAQAVINTVEAREREVVAKLDATILENDAKLKEREKIENKVFDWDIVSSLPQQASDLVATYEEVFLVPQDERVTKWFGDYALDVFKTKWEGVNPIQIQAMYNKALDSIDMTSEEFLANKDKFESRAIIAEKMKHKKYERLDDVISSCEKVSKKADVVDVNQHINNKEER